MINEDLPADDGDRAEQPTVVPNRRERRGHGQKGGAVNQVPGKAHQNTFAGRRVFRRKAG
ncbi:hypothetical protein [Saccharothrix syringae]|uniref:Uncharacterized protein n=1 Tax=Saccharothrix syringae TaxID=103733 RepID=A0A5Q0GVI4_SACSY|nr:hypothetical protein [Saccharothrix syringae]QFZ17504.1 hypothetical protein EKG83_08460 [Saccharothrix syringae]